jgi:RNA 2',3'-cyclic 3'-phosphodiesterase
VRLFVAAWPTDEVRRALGAIGTGTGDSVRWEAPDNWHVTLSFLGSVPDAELDPLVAALAPLAAIPPCLAVVGPATETLGRGVLCVPVTGLTDLADAVRAATLPFNRSTDHDRTFFGHLTLGRARQGRAIPRRAVGVPVGVSWSVEEVRLIASTTGPAGSRYDLAARVALVGPS